MAEKKGPSRPGGQRIVTPGRIGRGYAPPPRQIAPPKPSAGGGTSKGGSSKGGSK